jgi:hypothetical protein
MRLLAFLSGPRLALGILALLFTAPAWAEDPAAEFNAIKLSSLKGIESVIVIVLEAPAESRCPDLPNEQVQTDVETQLRQAGISIGPGSAAAYLFVSVVSVEVFKSHLYGFAVSVDLQEVVLLARDRRILTFGTTWHQGGIGVAATSRIPEYPRQMLAQIVDEFTTDYLEQNPKP